MAGVTAVTFGYAYFVGSPGLLFCWSGEPLHCCRLLYELAGI